MVKGPFLLVTPQPELGLGDPFWLRHTDIVGVKPDEVSGGCTLLRHGTVPLPVAESVDDIVSMVMQASGDPMVHQPSIFSRTG